MIDEDINERMARLVPQPGGIGEMPSQIPLGISMTPTFERPNAAPDIDTDYADAARRIADSRRTQMMSSLVNITAVDPDSAARSQKLGAQFGVGGDLAARNAEELRQRAFIDSISGRDMLRRNPVLADYIAQRQFAEIAHDDVDALAKTEQEFSKGWFSRFDRPVSEVVSEGIAGIGEGFGRAVAQEEMFAIAERVSQRGGRMEVYEKAALDSYREEMAKGGERTGFLEEAAYMGAQQLTGAPRIIEAGMMGATAGGALGLVGGPAGFATVPAGMATGFAAGLVAGRFENSRRLETAMLYLDLLPELGHDSSSKIANTVGIFNAALDTGAAALVAKPFAGLLRGAVRQKVSESIRQQTTRSALANAAKAYGIGVAGEVTTETVQELNNVIGSEIGRYLADKPMEIETEEGREAIATRLVDTFVATAMGMSIMGAPGPAGRLYVDTRAAKQGEQQAAKLQSMVKAIADNKLLARSPERLEEFAESAVEGTDSETTYVNAAVMHDILRQSGITEQEMDTVLPGVRAQLTEMQQNGIDLGNNDVTVPTAQMTVRLQKTPLLNQILPHARLSPDAMSITEVQQFEANREQLIADARQIMETRQETDATFVAEAQQVEDNAFEQVRPVLDAIKIDEDIDKDMAARTIAKLRQAMVVVDAAEAGMTPLQYEREYGSPLRVQGDVATVAPLEQAATVDKFGVATPQYRRAWHKATTGSPITVTAWHAPGGSNAAKLTEFARGRMGRETTLGGGWYGARDKDVAQTYGAPKEFQVTLQNPYVFSEASKSFVLKITNEELQRLRDAGHDGIIVKGVNATLQGQDRSHLEVIAFNPETAVQEVSAPFDQAATLDADYLAAVERGDMATAQRMVDEAAMASGYTINAYHGTDAPAFDVFGNFDPYNFGDASYFSPNRRYAEEYAEVNRTGKGEPRVLSVVLNLKNTFSPEENEEHLALYKKWAKEPRRTQNFFVYGPISEPYGSTGVRNLIDWQDQWWLVSKIKEAGFDSFTTSESDGETIAYGVFNPNQIKLSDPVTYDEQGNVVPLSRRFDITSPKLFEQAAQPGAARVLGPIEAAKKLVQETGRESFIDADEFFQKRWDALLKQTGRQLEPTSSNFAEAAKRAVSDILDFVKNNPKFADYYANDWRVTRAILDDYVGRPITDDEFALYRTIAGLTSPNTMLPSNISDTVGLWNHWMRFGNFDAFTLGPKPLTGALVVFEAAEPISGTTANIKVRTLKIIERLIKERGGVTQALQYLQEGVPVKELHKFNRKMGYAGNATDIGNITDLVMQATGQDKLIPRMFIFGQKVGAYTLNAVGDERYTTVDIWESRYIRSHFLGMFDKNIGLPESTEEHQIFTRFGDLFKQEMETVTGRKWAPSALQALRWFYIIGSSREAGYSKASTNETISFYTERQLTQAFGYSPSRAAGGGSGAGAVAAGSGAGKVLGGRIEPKPFERNLTKDVDKLTDVKLKRRAIAAGYVRFARHNSELGAGGFSFVERRLASPGRHGTLTSATVAAEFTAGSRLRTAFEKAELPIPVMQELVADENGAEAFRSLVGQTNESNPHGAAVAAYTADEYQQKRLFVTADGTAGFALTTDGDIVSVFSAPGSGNGRAVMALAVQVGGTRLDCFDTVLPSYYAAHGFRAVARLPWNDEYAPVGWDAKAFAAYNKGKPDVVFMVYEPGYTGEYKAGAGASVSEYGDGVAAQTSELNAIAKKRVFEQAAAGPARGGFDPRTLNIFIRSGGDISTMFHELIHLRIAEYLRLAAGTNPPARVVADLDILFKFMGVEGDTFEDRLRNYSTMSIEKRAPLEEKVTYNAEMYIWEGKAPSVELRGVFDRMAAWMRRAYKSIRDNLNDIYRDKFGTDLPILTPEVRGVFDRMLATEEQIKRQAALNEMKPQFQTLEQALASGMTEAEYAAYQVMQQEAMDAAVTDMTKASLRQMQWLGNARSRLLRDLQRKHDRQRKEVRDEVAEEIRLQPVYRAMEYLRTGTFVDSDGQSVKMEGPHRLDMEAVRNIYAGMPTPESLEAIRATGMAVPTNVAPDIAALGTGGKGMMGKDGIDPDVAAELFGYSSGDALIRALLAATPMKDAIDARTDEVMLARFSDLVDPKARDAAVQTALHNEARARFVAVELRFVAKATQPTRVLIEAARQAAREMIAGKRIVDVKPQEFIAAESRAARDAADLGKYESQAKITGKAEYDRVRLAALAAGSTEEDTVRVAEEAQAAFVAARTAEREAEFKARFGASTVQQALIRAKRAQLYQNQLAAEALRVREEVDKDVKYLKQVLRDSNVKRMGADYADQIERVLERFNLARLSAKARAERQSLVEWLAKLEQDGLVPDLAPEVIDEANRKPYQEMTVAEFRDLVEAVKQLEYVGKNAQKIKRAEKMAEFNEVRDEIVDSIKSNYTGKVTKPRTPTTAAGRRIAGMKRFLYSHLKAAAIARIFDGGKDDGPVWRYLIRTANAAGDMETRMRAEATKRLTEILAPVFKLGKMGGKGVYFPTIGQSLNREARLVIALNMGNDGNRQRLLDGEGWTLEQLTPVLESLTEAEWNAVQQVWDFLETYRPLIAAKERRLYGKEPNWVTPTPFTVRTADGKEVRLSGGYYPIKYDPVATERAETAEEAEAAKAQLRSAYTAATTRRSFTKARARQVRGRPLLYTMSGVYGGVNDVIHDLSWHEWLIQANRLMRDEKFSSTVRETYGVEAVRQLKDWIKDNAAGEQASQGAADQAASVLRRSVSAAGLGFNVVSAALQVTGFSQSIVRVGAKHIARGVALTVGSPIATFKAVNEKSSFMAERSRTQFRELNELRNMVQDESASARRLRLGTYFLMMRMQRMVDVPTWVGAYEKALEAGKDEDTAVALADQAVIDSQGGGMLKDLSAAERGGPVSKLFTVFYSYMNTVYNMGAVSTMTPRSKGRLASDYLMLFVVPVVLNYALKNALTPDVDDEEPDLEKIAQDLIAEELAFLMGTMVVVREFQNVANVVTGKETGARGYEGPAGLRGIGETMKFATQASQGEFDRAFRKSAVNMLGLATGLPSAQINRTLDGIEALAEGEVENPLAPLTGVKR